MRFVHNAPMAPLHSWCGWTCLLPPHCLVSARTDSEVMDMLCKHWRIHHTASAPDSNNKIIMQWQDIKKHILDSLTGLIGAMLTAALLAALQWLGAHIPEWLQAISTWGGAVAAIKAHTATYKA